MTNIYNALTAGDEKPQSTALLTIEINVDDDWIDYNGHMTEWQYYRLFADAGENMLRAMGFSEEYRLKGYSFFSVEGHLRNLKECRKGTHLKVFSEVIGYDDVRFHIYQYLIDVERDLTIATGEHMMLHVDTVKRKAVQMGTYIKDCVAASFDRWHPDLRPKGLGNQIKGAK